MPSYLTAAEGRWGEYGGVLSPLFSITLSYPFIPLFCSLQPSLSALYHTSSSLVFQPAYNFPSKCLLFKCISLTFPRFFYLHHVFSPFAFPTSHTISLPLKASLSPFLSLLPSLSLTLTAPLTHLTYESHPSPLLVHCINRDVQ